MSCGDNRETLSQIVLDTLAAVADEVNARRPGLRRDCRLYCRLSPLTLTNSTSHTWKGQKQKMAPPPAVIPYLKTSERAAASDTLLADQSANAHRMFETNAPQDLTTRRPPLPSPQTPA